MHQIDTLPKPGLCRHGEHGIACAQTAICISKLIFVKHNIKGKLSKPKSKASKGGLWWLHGHEIICDFFMPRLDKNDVSVKCCS